MVMYGRSDDFLHKTIFRFTAVCQDNISEESIETVMPEQQGGLFRPGFRKSASDITVLSNPSQSSIMVISTSSANYTAMDVPQEGEKTLSP